MIARKHAYCLELKALFESLKPGPLVKNEPRRMEVSSPNYVVPCESVPLKYFEANDMDEDLRQTEHTRQLRRYRDTFSNLIFRDQSE